MLIKKSIKRTKTLLHRTFNGFKSFLSKSYQRLPQLPSIDPFCCLDQSKLHQSFRDIHSFRNNDPTVQFADDANENKPTTKKIDSRECSKKFSSRRHFDRLLKLDVTEGAGSSSRRRRIHACCVVGQSLKELEHMDACDVDHVLDVEEIFHYYSRITCPLYIDIFNKFFLENYSDLLPQMSRGNLSQRISGG